jgi:hypothetical protein
MRTFLILLLSLLSLSSQAQVKSSVADTILYSKILVVPYNPYMHLSDADDDISEFSEKNKAEIRKQFRLGLLQDVNERLTTSYQVYGTRNFVGQDEQQDIEALYSMIDYHLDTVCPPVYPIKDTLTLKEKLFGNTKTKPKGEKMEYMNIGISHPEVLTLYSKKYGTDLFIFLNQFDIKTNYNNCHDLALKTYDREIKVHYSLFDAAGKQVYGDAVTVFIPHSSNYVDEIIAKNFPAISDYIYKHIPPKKIIAQSTASN